jgi:hypothetical protein
VKRSGPLLAAIVACGCSRGPVALGVSPDAGLPGGDALAGIADTAADTQLGAGDVAGAEASAGDASAGADAAAPACEAAWADPRRWFVSRNAASCKATDWDCLPGQPSFQDECGCGCIVDQPSCAFDARYVSFWADEDSAHFDQSALLPPRTHLLTRVLPVDRREVTCMVPLPCEEPLDDTVVRSVTGLRAAIAHPEVRAALAQPMPPHYGGPPLPVGPGTWWFQRQDGRGFSLGPGTAPDGIRNLQRVLERRIEETLATPACRSAGVTP